MGFIDRPSADTTVAAPTPAWAVAQASARDCHVPSAFRSCRSSRLQRFPTQRADPEIRPSDGLRVCCTPQPAMGFTTFRTPCSVSRPSADPKVVDLAVHPGVVPCGEDPSKRSPPRQLSTMPSPRPVLSDAIAYTGWCALSPFRALPVRVSPRARTVPADLKAFFHRGVRCDARDVAEARSLDAPLGFGSTRSRCCRAFRARPVCWTFRLAARTASASPDPNVEGRQGVSALSGSCDPSAARSPKGRSQRVAVAPASPEGVASAALHHGPRRTGGVPVDPPREEVPPRRLPHPKAWACRRHRDASPKRLVRDPALAPKSGVRWFELVPTILPRSPAYLMVRPLAALTHARRRVRVRATRAHPEGCCVEPHTATPEGARRAASRGRHPEVDPWRLVAPASPASWRAGSGQTVIAFTGTAGTRSEDEVPPRSEDRNDRRRSAVGAVGPHIPPAVVIRRCTEVQRRDGP
jgi:hypothetical protein